MIASIELFSYELTYVGGRYAMSGGRTVDVLESTVVRVITEEGIDGYGETCPLGSTYLPAHAGGARAALSLLAPSLLGVDVSSPGAVAGAMDRALRGHEYARSALEIACWDAFGKGAGLAACDLLGGRLQDEFPLYVAISLDAPRLMREAVARHRQAGVRRFQLKLGEDPVADAERARAVVEASEPGELVVGDANGSWRLREAVEAVRLLGDLPRFVLEQPCATLEECARVRERTELPLLLDESIVDVQALLRAWELGALEGFNLKLNRVGGLGPACRLRDLGHSLGLTVNVEDSWGGDLTTAAVSHLAASTAPETLTMASFMNDWTREHVAGYRPRSAGGRGAAPRGAGLGIEVDRGALGSPFARFEFSEHLDTLVS